VTLLFEHKAARYDEVSQSDKGHGRVEKRRLRVSRGLEGCRPVPEFLDWPGVEQALQMERTVIRKGKQTQETAYAITSLAAQETTPARLMALWRGQWSIEDRSHYVRDVTFGEDHCQVRSGNAPEVLAALRNAVITLVRAAGHANMAAALRRFAAKPMEAIGLVMKLLL
jgi:predicted transposase YbfD/YdcC